MSSLRVLLVVAAFAAVVADVTFWPVPIPWSDCGTNEHLHVTEATASEWPPAYGSSFSFTLAGYTDEDITGGTYEAAVYLDGIKLFDQSGDLSSLGVPLPIAAGNFNITKEDLSVPTLPLKGTVKIHAQVQDQNGNWVICAEISALLGANLVNQQDKIDQLNAMGGSWVAEANSYFDGWTIEEASRLMGVKRNPNLQLPINNIPAVALPTDFDPRVGSNSSCIGPVLDQGRCGSCWAFGAAEAISDRTCLQGDGTFLQLAALDLVTCDQGDNGCQGGDPGSAWQYAQTDGLVTEACLPYLTSEGGPIPTCPPDSQPCLNFVNTPPCKEKCANKVPFSSDKHFVSSVYQINSVPSIMQEITANGPVEAAFTVYQDFLAYKSGVYEHKTGQELGGHAIKMIGFGTENGVNYWLCQNSWTTTWGDGGYFKIKRGVDECGIEDEVVAGMV